ncbi:MAG: helix-turn-helix domain-containing protein [Candidatus Gracilibacteria bacterium]|nr:helix-turn-helix domain-containing protein [Candidatus Gracilibacteria bacterium]
MIHKTTSCPVNNLFLQLSKQWIIFIFHNLATGEKTFSGLKKTLKGISSRTLSLRLKDLQELGFIERLIVQEQPIKIEYLLTEKGQSLTNELEKLGKWASEWEKKYNNIFI